MQKPTKHDILLIIALFALALIITQGLPMLKSHHPKSVTPADTVYIVKYDSIPKNDRIYMKRLKPYLKKQECFSDTIYVSRKVQYIGYGHAVLHGEHFTKITEAQGDSILDVDMWKKYWVLKDIQRRTLFRDVKRLFTGEPL